jgi:hypothetical protein
LLLFSAGIFILVSWNLVTEHKPEKRPTSRCLRIGAL